LIESNLPTLAVPKHASGIVWGHHSYLAGVSACTQHPILTNDALAYTKQWSTPKQTRSNWHMNVHAPAQAASWIKSPGRK